MSSKKKQRRIQRTAGTIAAPPPADAGSAPGSGVPDQIKWRWRVLLSALLALSFLILFLSWIKFFDLMAIDRHLQDILISYVGSTESKPFDSRVALILVDKNNQPNQPYGAANPSHRKYHAELIRSLTQAGAKVIVFDVLFRTNSAEVDPDFAKAIQEAEKAGTKIVVGAFLEPNKYEPQIAGPIKTAVGDHWGIVDGGTLKKSDARFIRLAAEMSNDPFNGFDEEPVFPSLALQAVRMLNYPNAQTTTWFSPLTGQVRLRSGGAGGNLLDSIPVNRDMYLLVDLPGKAEITNYSYQEILAHLNDYAGNFKDKIVVIGYQENDLLPGSASDPRYGSEIHATAMSTLLTGAYIRPLPVLYHYIFIVVLVAIAAFLQIRFSKWMDRMTTVPLSFLPAPINKITIPTPIFVISLIYLLFAVLAFKLGHIVFDMSYHLAALVLTYFLFVIGRSKFVR